MITKTGGLKCDECGKFIAGNDFEAMVMTPYGNTTDYDPPEDEHECGTCFSKKTEKQKEVLERDCWRAPGRIFKTP